jgi:hypothetical protein
VKHWLAMAFVHRQPLLFCGGALLAGATAALYTVQQLDAASSRLAALQQQAARTTQGLAELRSAAAAFDELALAATAPGDLLAGPTSAPNLSIEASPQRESAAGGWRTSEFRLRGPLLHEEILLDIVDRWSRQSAFQHQLRHCALHRQAARLFADCQFVQLLPTGSAR